MWEHPQHNRWQQLAQVCVLSGVRCRKYWLFCVCVFVVIVCVFSYYFLTLYILLAMLMMAMTVSRWHERADGRDKWGVVWECRQHNHTGPVPSGHHPPALWGHSHQTYRCGCQSISGQYTTSLLFGGTVTKPITVDAKPFQVSALPVCSLGAQSPSLLH